MRRLCERVVVRPARRAPLVPLSLNTAFVARSPGCFDAPPACDAPSWLAGSRNHLGGPRRPHFSAVCRPFCLHPPCLCPLPATQPPDSNNRFFKFSFMSCNYLTRCCCEEHNAAKAVRDGGGGGRCAVHQAPAGNPLSSCAPLETPLTLPASGLWRRVDVKRRRATWRAQQPLGEQVPIMGHILTGRPTCTAGREVLWRRDWLQLSAIWYIHVWCSVALIN